MGLNFRHSSAQWSYSGFMRFRERLAEAEGIELKKMWGFGEPFLPWKPVKNDIKHFLNHSDCDGQIGPAKLKLIYPIIERIVTPWEHDHDRANALELVETMKKCIKKKQPLIFQ